ncbi:MAG TPA: PIG-L family deacetylase [Chitinophagaceae bacterium]|nr:PIG-L family deacetylase [Chitinophagaceae bacterium]
MMRSSLKFVLYYFKKELGSLPVMLIVGCFLISVSGLSQAPQSWTSAEMYQAIRKLNVLGTVLYVAAHPDDENTRLIAYLSKDRLYRTGYLSLTRGDGGQNLIGNEQGIELGLIRTQELLAARRVDGGEQFFTRAFDFGFSKNHQETFTKWDQEKILSDVVWIVRKFQPDVIITRFPTTGEGGHGHHTGSAILANEAFVAAADPRRFPEQLKFVDTWQPKRVLWNSFNFGGTNLTSPDQFKFDVGGYNPLLGKSYGEIAAESRSQHKSQGFGVPAGRGEALEFFKTTAGEAPLTDLMDGVELGWKKVKGGEAIEKIVDSLATGFDFLRPDKSVKGLVRLYKALESMPAGHWQSRKMAETKTLIAQCSGLFFDATTNEQFAVKTDSIRVNFSFNNRLGVDAILQKVTLAAGNRSDSVFNQPLAKNRNLNYFKVFYIDPSTAETQPYWLEQKMEEGSFNVKDPQLIGNPDVEPSFWMSCLINIEGETFEFTRPVRYKFTDPVKGELYEPLVVIPPLLVTPDETVKMTRDHNNFDGVLKVQAKKRNVSGVVTGNGRSASARPAFEFRPDRVSITDRNGIAEVGYKIKAAGDSEYTFAITSDSIRKASSVSTEEGYRNSFYKDMHEIKYDHIPYINYFTDATVVNRKLDLKIYNKKIGYIIGAGDKVPEALEQMGYEVLLLGSKELSRNNLSQFDAIITGVRAYNTNDWMNTYYNKLMRYVQEGGNLIVQYNTSSNLGPVRAKIGPFPFTIVRTRVTDENAPVSILKPDHPVFNFPNKITPEDFTGWIQERSVYHGSDTTGKYERLIGMTDPGEKQEEGSLLVTKYGKGYFTYTGIVFFRQLPAGVPGAYRLLANIIALNRKKAF